MKQYYTQILMVIGVISLLIMPKGVTAAGVGDGIEFRIALNDGRYEVYMRPNMNPTGPALTLTSQVTIKVPHGVLESSFQVTDLTSAVAGAEWSLSSRINAPMEDTRADYLSFTVAFPDGNHRAFNWQADEELLVFSFANKGSCQGTVELLRNDDPFTTDLEAGVINSANTNPGNQIDVLNMGDSNIYIGNYGTTVTCGNRSLRSDNYLYIPIVSSQ